MTPLPLRIDPLPPLPAGLPGDPITGNTGGSSGGGQAGTSLQLSYYGYDHLGNTRMVFHTVLKAGEEDPTYVPEYLADYYPYGKILREWLNCTGERYLTTQHERDIETGYDYRGARFYDSDLGRFLSVDPLAAEYAGWSGYHYVLGNPVRLVDPDGRSVRTEVYDLKGRKVGEDASGRDGNIAFVDSNVAKELRKGNITPDEAIASSNYKTTRIVLEESSDVLNRTYKNGGLNEEVSIVTSGGAIFRGDTGPSTLQGGAKSASIRNVEGDDNTLIHSHITGMQEINGRRFGSNAAEPTNVDRQEAFPLFRENVIVGKLGNPVSIEGESVPRPDGAVFYNRSGEKMLTLEMTVLRKIINDQ